MNRSIFLIIFLSSEFCPYAGLSYGDSIISVQAHPEFEAAYEFALLETYGGTVVPEDVAAQATASMRGGKSADTQLLASWFGNFFLLQLQELQTSQRQHGFVELSHEEIFKVCLRHRFAEVVALYKITVERSQVFPLLGSFDTFGDNFQA